MKKLIAVIAFLLLPAMAFAETTSDGQYLIKINKRFANDNFFMHGALFGSETNSYTALFTYLGPNFNIGDHNLKLLAGSKHDKFATYATASVWYYTPLRQYKNSDGKKITTDDIWAEVDLYYLLQTREEPTFDQFYTAGGYTHHFDSYSLSLDFETMANLGGDWFEAAVGPAIQAGRVKLWVGYDNMPDLEDEAYFARLVFDFAGIEFK